MLAPAMRGRVEGYILDARKIDVVNGEAFDPIIFETSRSERLQEIYFEQGTTRAFTAIYGWHFYCVAVDIISRKKEWSVSEAWWKESARLMRKNGIDPGYDWHEKDRPHGQFHGIKKSPSDLSRTLYFGTAHWQGMKPFTDSAEHHAGLERVWRKIGAM